MLSSNDSNLKIDLIDPLLLKLELILHFFLLKENVIEKIEEQSNVGKK